MRAKTECVLQAGAFAFHHGHICLVTSRSGKRWVIPKGRLEDGKTPREIVLQEAWEEAGLVGVVGRMPIGRYEYRKAGKLHIVDVYVMHVTTVKKTWPEQCRRERQWLTPNQAHGLLQNFDLRSLLASITTRPLAA